MRLWARSYLEHMLWNNYDGTYSWGKWLGSNSLNLCIFYGTYLDRRPFREVSVLFNKQFHVCWLNSNWCSASWGVALSNVKCLFLYSCWFILFFFFECYHVCAMLLQVSLFVLLIAFHSCRKVHCTSIICCHDEPLTYVLTAYGIK